MSYGIEEIRALKGLEPVRQNPGMFISDTGFHGLHQIIWEPLDNSIDEALAGHCTDITVELSADGYVSITDNGRGIPTDIHKEEKISGVELVLTRLHAGGKFDREEGTPYKVSGGLHGVGVSCTNALSDHLIAKVRRNGKEFQIEFKKGLTQYPLKEIGTSSEHGTSVKFKPDPTIFTETIIFDRDLIETRLKQLSYLNSGLKIHFIDSRDAEKLYKQEFFSESGLKDYLNTLIEDKETIFPETLIFSGVVTGTDIQIVMNYYKDIYTEKTLAFTNNIHNKDGGTHVQGFTRQLSSIMSDYCTALYPKKKELPTIEDFKEGLISIVSVKLSKPQFSNQTKDKLITSEVSKAVSSLLKDKLVQYFDSHPQIIKFLVDKSFRALEAREAARKAKEQVQKKSREVYLDSSKFADCLSKNPLETEIFFVEGDSAGGTARTGRDRKFQAILSLKGKPQNTHDINLNQIYDNKEISQLIAALGCSIGPTFDKAKLRYHKIIAMADADVDGSHISILLLTFFHKYFKPLIESGNVYLAVPPLYKIKQKDSYKYIKDDAALTQYKAQLQGKMPDISRFKGLGEMNATELWESTMDPANRTLIQVKISDTQKAVELFEQLMGKATTKDRRQLIEDKGYLARIDV